MCVISQSALTEHRKTVENIDSQIEASARDRQKIIQTTLDNIDTEWKDATKRGGEAIDDLFQLSRALGQSVSGIFEIIGFGMLMRRFSKKNSRSRCV